MYMIFFKKCIGLNKLSIKIGFVQNNLACTKERGKNVKRKRDS